MNKNLIIFSITVLLICSGLSGCFNNNTDNKTNNNSSGNGNVSETSLIMTDWQYDTYWDPDLGDNRIRIDLTIKNNGTANATRVKVQLYGTNQYGLLEVNKTAILPDLAPNQVHDAYYKFGYETESILINCYITIKWDGISKEYLRVINL